MSTPPEFLSKLAEYLDWLHGALLAIDADVKIDDCAPPDVWADRIREYLNGPAQQTNYPLSDIAVEARFLLERLGELDDANDKEYVREFEGHVRPSMSRLEHLLTEPAQCAPQPSWEQSLFDLIIFTDVVRSGDFYKDYDASTELLGKADRAIAALSAPPAVSCAAREAPGFDINNDLPATDAVLALPQLALSNSPPGERVEEIPGELLASGGEASKREAEIERLKADLAEEEDESASYHKFWIEQRDANKALREALVVAEGFLNDLALKTGPIEALAPIRAALAVVPDSRGSGGTRS